MAEVRDPVCGMTFPEEDAEALGAFKVARRGQVHWFCSKTCRDTFEQGPSRRTAPAGGEG